MHGSDRVVTLPFLRREVFKRGVCKDDSRRRETVKERLRLEHVLVLEAPSVRVREVGKHQAQFADFNGEWVAFEALEHSEQVLVPLGGTPFTGEKLAQS